VPLKLHTTDAYILLVPPPPKLADGAAAAAAAPAHEPAGASAQADCGGGEAPSKAWRAYYWLGASCTADKSGAAAALVVQLSGLLMCDDRAVSLQREIASDGWPLMASDGHLWPVMATYGL
jgi:hypothetical protein